jgi:poly-gamma-glutamate capsule biosynthesis protein CapA/YwtB (metallophosphatase superfamily)
MRASLLVFFAVWGSLMTPLVQAEEAMIDLVFVGDIMLDDGPGRTIAAGGDPLAQVDALIRSADFAIGNLECPVSAGGVELDNKIETFRAAPEVMRVLKGRFAALSVANNHAGDWGQGGFVDTINAVRAAGIAPIGGGANQREAHAPVWLEKHGVRIALLAYNEYKPRRFEAGPNWPGLAWSEDSYVLTDIRAAKAAGADIVIPFMHWGWENERKPDARQYHLAKLMLGAGASAIVGAHPHVTQGADVFDGKPVLWSLGNFVFDGFEPGPGRVGWTLHLRVSRRGVERWHTRVVEMDEHGTPRLVDAPSPCGEKGGRVRDCVPGAL